MSDLQPYQYIPIMRKRLLEKLKKINVALLENYDLDFWVAVSDGYTMNPYIIKSEAHMIRGDHWALPGKRILPSGEINGYSYYPSSNQEQALPLIEKNNVKSRKMGMKWNSVIPSNTWISTGNTELESAMRCIVINFKEKINAK